MFLLVLKYDGDNSEAKIGYAMMALEAYGCIQYMFLLKIQEVLIRKRTAL